MIAFELSMPNVGSWNKKWSQEGKCFVRCYNQRKVPKEYWNNSFYYRWDDGWTACVTTRKITSAEAKKLKHTKANTTRMLLILLNNIDYSRKKSRNIKKK